MNNKGQSLIIFVLILPVLLLLITLVFEIGNLNYSVNKYKKEIKRTIEYGLNNIEKDNLEEILTNLLKSNIKGQINIEINNQKIKINVKDKILFNNKFDINITYIGYKENNKIIIKQE